MYCRSSEGFTVTTLLVGEHASFWLDGRQAESNSVTSGWPIITGDVL